MEKKKEMCTKRNTGLVRTLYVISAILLLIFIFMLIESIGYVRSYIAAYGMPAGEMIKESIQYVVKDSLNYFVYALLVFCAAKTINIMGCKSAVSNAVESSNSQTEQAAADNQCPDIEPAEDIAEIEQVETIDIDIDSEQPVQPEAEDESESIEQAVLTDEEENGDIEQLELTDEDKNGDIELPDLTESEETEVNAEPENIEAADNQCPDIDLIEDIVEIEADPEPENTVIEKNDYIYVSNVVESSNIQTEPAEADAAEADMEEDSENDDYRFEPDKVISRLGEISRKPAQKKIVEEAIGGQSRESEEE